MIPREVIDEIRYRCDIEEVISSYVTLKRAGSNRHGLCPFHSEKTPSFTVFPATKSFYCFGCGAGGDVISFIQKVENLDYVGAIEYLAARAGIAIPEDGRGQGSGVSRKRVLDMNLAAARFFRECLFDPVIGRDAMAYLSGKRGLSGAVIKRFGLGFAPNDFGALTKHMRALGYTEQELITAFLCGKSQKTGRAFDLFRNRIIFPVLDTAGNVVAFGGRVMDDSKPKYLNTSDTPCFKKSKVLFGLNFARNACAEQTILCEGYMDAIAMHAAGFECAVATLGTAITPDHARLLSRYTKRVVINYDSDAAGQQAANKAMALLDEVGLDVRVLRLTGAKDADEYIRTYGADAFRKILGESRTAFDYKLENLSRQHDITQTEGKIRAARALAAIIAETASAVERELYITVAARHLGITTEVLANDVKRVRAKQRRDQRTKEKRDLVLTARNFGDRVNPDAAKNPMVAAAEEAALGLLMLFPEHRKAVADGKVTLTENDFFTALGKRAFHVIMDMEKGEDGYSFSAMGEHFTPDEMGRMERLRQERQALDNNSLEVLSAVTETLVRERERREAGERGDWQSEILRRRAELQKNKKK